MQLDQDSLWYKVMTMRYMLLEGRFRDGGVFVVYGDNISVVFAVVRVWKRVGSSMLIW